MPYDLFEHRHRFAMWAGARAAQRGLTSIGVFRDCLNATDLRAFLSRPASLRTNAATFDALHRRWCSRILQLLRRADLEKASYGHAAKFVAIYLKAMVVVGPHGDSLLSSVIHPPIDRILLKNLTAAHADVDRIRRWRSTSWTSLDKRKYYALISDLRMILPKGEPFWRLETHWTVTGAGGSQGGR